MRRLYRTDGTTQDFDKPMTMTECRAAIGAETIDTVILRHLGYPTQVMLVNDAGYDTRVVENGNHTELVPVRARLPLNQEATRLYLLNCRPNTDHQIVGDVIVVPDEDFA